MDLRKGILSLVISLFKITPSALRKDLTSKDDQKSRIRFERNISSACKEVSLNLRFLFYLGIFLSLISVGFSTCSYTPQYTQIYSGSNYLGNFSEGSQIYVLPNLQADPIKFIYYFNNSQSNCFSQKSDVLMKLFPSSGNVAANSLTTTQVGTSSQYLTKASFTFQVSNFIIQSPFTSSFFVKNSNNNYTSGSFSMGIDNQSPTISTTQDLTKTIYNSGDVVNVGIQISDQQSGLDSVVISGLGINKLINFNASQTSYSSTLQLNLSNGGGNLSITAIDKLSNKAQKNLSFFVDNQPPTIINNQNSLKFDKVYSYVNGVQEVSFENMILTDNSLNYGGSAKMTGDFSSFSSSSSSVKPSCTQTSNGNYDCSFMNIPISISQTANKNVIFKTVDSAGNSKDYTYSTEIFVDNQAPKILDFYLENKMGVKNEASANDNSSYVYLKFSDASITNGNVLPRVIPNFGLISSPNNLLGNTSCPNVIDKSTGVAECTWKIGNQTSVFADAGVNSTKFSVTLVDEYGNQDGSSFNLSIDNTPPKVEKVDIVKNSGIQDGIIKSGDLVNFRVYIKDDNLASNGNYFVSGNFTSISSKAGYDIRNGTCSQYNTSVVRCDFNSIQARDGYRNETVNFKISDSAGNTIYYPLNVQIFRKGNETINDAYQILDANPANLNNANYLLILNPINRNNIMQSEVTAWFEGKVSLKTPTDNFQIVNYGLKNCHLENSSEPFLLGNIQLYPNSTVVYHNLSDATFALMIQIKQQANPTAMDLNNFNMDCQLSVLKRDNTTLYTPEIVNFTTHIGFYALPRGNFLKAQASKINQLIKSADFLGSWFGTTYKVYNVLKSACTVVNSGGTIMNTVSGVLDYAQIALTPFGYGSTVSAPRSASETSKNYLMEMLGGAGKYVRQACDWVQCSGPNGGGGGFLGGSSNLFGALTKIQGFQNKISAFCKQPSK